MRRIGKQLCSLMLALTLAVSCALPALAADTGDAQRQAEALKELNLFRGTAQGFELDRAPTRMEALVMLLRLSGKEWEAIYSGSDQDGAAARHPFTDVPSGW